MSRQKRKNKGKGKGMIKKKLCQALFVIYIVTVGVIMINSFDTKNFFPYLAITIISYFVMLFIYVFHCPYIGGSSSNIKSNSGGSSSNVFSDGSD